MDPNMGQQEGCGWYTRFDCKRICKDWWYFPWWFVKTTRWDVQVICSPSHLKMVIQRREPTKSCRCPRGNGKVW